MKAKAPLSAESRASEFKMSLLDRKNYEVSRSDLQAAFVATRYFIPASRARLISELAFGMEVRS